MSGNSSVGTAGVYEAGDQRNPPDSEKQENQAEPFDKGKENSHQANDPKDERSIKNRLDAASDQNDQSTSGKTLSEEDIAAQQDATLPAKLHGNEPSKGAKIDAQIQAEEEAEIAKKDAAKAQKKKN